MAGWPGKYIIGLTGNIATGKSMVRRMLEHLGAYGIDADALVHRAMAEGAPGYAPIVELFGKYILDEDGQINRERLGRIVFSDLNAMAQLEGVVHPLVHQAVDLLVRRSNQQVVVIEAIKLLEGDLRHRFPNATIAPSNVPCSYMEPGLMHKVLPMRVAPRPSWMCP